MAIFKKKISAKVYGSSGSFIATWGAFSFGGFTKELDSGVGECVMDLDLYFGYQGADLVEGNRVDIVVSDRDTVQQTDEAASRIIYRGYISLIEQDVDGQKENVRVHLLGYYTLLALDVLKNGVQTTLYSNTAAGLTVTSGSIGAADVGLMMRAVIDRYRAETVDPKLFYTLAGIPNTGTTAEYTFKQASYRTALDALRKMGPAGYFYYVGETGEITFKTKPTSATHKFTFGRHFKKLHVESSLEKVRNVALIWNGPIASPSVYNHYEDAASISKYGRRAQTQNDYGAADDSLDLRGTRYVSENKDPQLRVVCTIMDNNGAETLDGEGNPTTGYDIESIQPGDTCSFYGFGAGAAEFFQENMLITKVDYRLDSVDITVEIVKGGVLEAQQKQGEAIQEIGAGGLAIPATYT